MASIRKRRNSPYWTACFTLSDGTRKQTTTKTRNRTEAMQIAIAAENAARGSGIERQVRAIFDGLLSNIGVTQKTSISVGEFCAQWLASKKNELSPSSIKAYSHRLKSFVSFVGETKSLDSIDPSNIIAFRDSLTLASGTTNLALKIISTALKDAWVQGLIKENPASKVRRVKNKKEKISRRAFTPEEIQKILAASSGEWTGIILFGLFTGQRLSDIANARMDDIDPNKEWWNLCTKKTGRKQSCPLTQEPRSILPPMNKGFIFPKAAKSFSSASGAGTLSNQFRRILEQSGLVERRDHKKHKEGRGTEREICEISFHSLRHTTTSILKTMGVPEAIVMEIVGHESKAINRAYTHIPQDSLREAISKISIDPK